MKATAAATATATTAAQAKSYARTAARDLLRARMQPITALAELAAAVNTARTEVDDARRRWRDAQTAYAHGYRAARAAGWSPTELHDIGCGPQPAGTALRTPPPRTTPDTDEASSDEASSDEPSTDERSADERGGVE